MATFTTFEDEDEGAGGGASAQNQHEPNEAECEPAAPPHSTPTAAATSSHSSAHHHHHHQHPTAAQQSAAVSGANTNVSSSISFSWGSSSRPASISSSSSSPFEQLLEENNNDPNNNVQDADNDGQPRPVEDNQLNVFQERLMDPQPNSQVSTQPNMELEHDLSYSTATNDSANDLTEAISADSQMEEECGTLMKVLPQQSREDILSKISAFRDRPNRTVLVIEAFLNHLSNKDDDVIIVEKKNKVGNGLKCKNPPRKRCADTSKPNQSSTSNPGPSSQNNEAVKGISAMSGPEIPLKKPKLPYLDYEEEMAATMPQEYGGKMAKRREKIEVKPSEMYGPYDFTSHRPKHERSSSVLSEAAAAPMPGSISASKPESASAMTPEIITLDSPSPPLNTFVDLVQDEKQVVDTKQDEKLQLVTHLTEMFPNLSEKYLSAHAEALIGNQGAISEFIENLLLDRRPPTPEQTSTHKNESPAVTVAPVPPPQEQLIPAREDQSTAMATSIQTNMASQSVTGAIPSADAPATATPVLAANGVSITEATQSITVPTTATAPYEPPKTVIEEDPLEGPSTRLDLSVKSEENPIVDSEEDQVNARHASLIEIFPNVDPDFLREKAESAESQESLTQWVSETIENGTGSFPTRADYEKRKKTEELVEQFSRERVDPEEIMKQYNGDPFSYFRNLDRTVDEDYKKHSHYYLKKSFRKLLNNHIVKSFKQHRGLFYPTYKDLQQLTLIKGNRRKSKRLDSECIDPGVGINLGFLKELQFTRNEEILIAYQSRMKERRRDMIENARQANELKMCGICLEDDLLEDDMLPCENGCSFCKTCIATASDVAIGDSLSELKCFGTCNGKFPLSTLQQAVEPSRFSKWLRKIQLAEVAEAGIAGLEHCPFCEFVTIMESSPEENKLFQCQAPDCGKESCRLCKEMSHIPVKCEEVEKDAEVRKRTYIENKMTEALLRKCWKCKNSFLKESGCNKMTCSCGAKMCYLCRQPLPSDEKQAYAHFYGQGRQAEEGRNCPLFCNDEAVHNQNVAEGARAAIQEAEQQQPGVKLKHNPTENLPNTNAVEITGKRFPRVEDVLGIRNEHARRRFLMQQREIEIDIQRQRVQDGMRDLHGPQNPAVGRLVAPGGAGGVINHGAGVFNDVGNFFLRREEERQRLRALQQEEQALAAHFIPRPTDLAFPPALPPARVPTLVAPANSPRPLNIPENVYIGNQNAAAQMPDARKHEPYRPGNMPMYPNPIPAHQVYIRPPVFNPGAGMLDRLPNPNNLLPAPAPAHGTRNNTAQQGGIDNRGNPANARQNYPQNLAAGGQHQQFDGALPILDQDDLNFL